MDVLVGLIGLVVGATLCLSGLRLFFILLPIWGFIAGVLIGAAGVTAVLGDGFLATTLGLVIGLIVGIVFAAISYLYWYVGVLLSAGVAGAVLGAAVFASFGVDSGWLLFIVGVITGGLFVAGAFIINYPMYLVIVNTALAGAAVAIGGLLLVINSVDRSEIGTGAIWEKISDNWFLWLIWIVASAVGIIAQLRMVASVKLPEDRWTRAQPPAAGATA
jgi:hypothetical protein